MSNDMKKVEEFFETGDLESAKYLLLSMLETDPENSEILNNLAVILFQEKSFEKALKYIKRALNADPGNKDAILNYADISAAMGKLSRAKPEIEAYLKINPGDVDVEELLKKAGGEKSSAKQKLVIICIKGLDNFLENVELALSEHFEVSKCITTNGVEMTKAVETADIVWLEWANESTVDLTKNPKTLSGKHVICRLHSYEAFAPYMQQIDWKKINDLVFVGESLKNISLTFYPQIEQKVDRIHVVPTGIDLDKFKLKERQKGKNLAFLGSVNYKKGPMLLFHAFAELAKKDPSYKLFIAGEIQDMRYHLYFQQMADTLGILENIKFDGKVTDVQKWLSDKNYIICSSVLESQCLAVMESMACGIKPLVHNFVGAKSIYPKEFVWNTIGEFVEMVESSDYDSKIYRQIIKDRYSLETQIKQLQEVTRELR